jgi:hypothetical protein
MQNVRLPTTRLGKTPINKDSPKNAVKPVKRTWLNSITAAIAYTKMPMEIIPDSALKTKPNNAKN